MVASFLAVIAVAIATPAPELERREHGALVIDKVLYTPVEQPSALCTATYAFVDRVLDAYAATPEVRALAQTRNYKEFQTLYEKLSRSKCGPYIDFQPSDGPDCALERYTVQRARASMQGTPEYVATLELPHLWRAAFAVAGGSEDGCYTEADLL